MLLVREPFKTDENSRNVRQLKEVFLRLGDWVLQNGKVILLEMPNPRQAVYLLFMRRASRRGCRYFTDVMSGDLRDLTGRRDEVSSRQKGGLFFGPRQKTGGSVDLRFIVLLNRPSRWLKGKNDYPIVLVGDVKVVFAG